MSVSHVFAITETPLLGGLKTYGLRAYRLYWQTLRCFSDFQVFLLEFLWGLVFSKQPTVNNWGVSRGKDMAVAVAVGVSDRWHVTRNTLHVTPDTWHMTLAIFLFIYFFSMFSSPFLSVYVRFGIGATIGTCQENQCWP